MTVQRHERTFRQTIQPVSKNANTKNVGSVSKPPRTSACTTGKYLVGATAARTAPSRRVTSHEELASGWLLTTATTRLSATTAAVAHHDTHRAVKARWGACAGVVVTLPTLERHERVRPFRSVAEREYLDLFLRASSVAASRWRDH